MSSDCTAAWVPYLSGRTLAEATAVALRWAEQEAATIGLPVIAVSGGRNATNAGPIFRRHSSRRATSDSAKEPAEPTGVIVVTMPTFTVMRWATRASAGKALVAVDRRGPERITGWAAALGALNLDDGQPAALDPQVRQYLTELVRYDAHGFTDPWSRDSAHRLLAGMAADGLLERAVVLGALVAYGISASGLDTVARLIDVILPVATWFGAP